MSDDKKGIFIKPKAKGAPAASNLNKPKDVKKRWLAVGGVFIGVVLVSSTLFGEKPQPKIIKPVDEKAGPSISVNPNSGQEKAFQAKYAEDQAKLVEELRKAKDDLQALKAKVDEKEKQPSTSTGTAGTPTLPPNIVEPPAPDGSSKPTNLNKPPEPPQLIERNKAGAIIDPKAASGSGGAGSETPSLGLKQGNGPRRFSPPAETSSATPAKSGSALDNALAATHSAAVAAKMSFKKNSSAGTLVAGAFAPITVLNGIDAGTSQANQSNPLPVLINVTDQATLPGSAKYKIKNCFILGTGYGDLSAERVYIRTSRLSCVDKSNRLVLAQEAPGYIVDSDGKLGMRGVITDKQGAKLGKAMLAGFAQGLAGALGQAQGTVSSTILGGNTNSISGSAALRASGLNGAQSAINVLADTYIKEAQNLFPVITIDAGRVGTVVFTDTKQLSWTDGESSYVAETTPNVK